MNRNQRILNNTIVFAIGNFGTKILSFFMVLIYTYYVSVSDLGYYDLIVTTISLIQPIFLLAFDEGIYRWLINSNTLQKKEIIATCLKVTSITTFCSVLFIIFLNFKFHFRVIPLIIIFNVFSLFYQIFLNAVRGLGNNVLYAESGILNTFLVLIIEAIGLICLSMGIEILFISKIIASIFTIIFIYLKEPTFRGVISVPFNKSLAKKITNYTLPLIPNQLSWWVVNVSDRYIIVYFLGTTFNGIYAISNKFPMIISAITGIIYFALQETIIKEYDSNDRNEFYSEIFEKYYKLLFCMIIFMIPCSKVIIQLFVSANYTSAWKYTGFLFMSVIFSALSSFLGIGYQISKETKRSVVSTMLAAAINIIVNVVLIRMSGLHAASFSTFIAYASLFAVRIFHSKKYFNLHINWRLFIGLTVLSLITMIYSFYIDALMNIILLFVSIIFFIYINKSTIYALFNNKVNL